MKAKTKLAIAVFFFSLCFSISCDENVPEPVEAIDQQKFSLEQFDGAIQENLAIQHDDFVEAGIRIDPSAALRSSDRSKEKWIEYKASFKGYITLEDNTSSRNIFFTLLKHVRDDGPPVFILLKFVPSITLESSKEYTYFNLQDFAGTIYTYNRSAEMEYAIGVTDGRVKDFSRVGMEEGRNTSGGRVQYAFPPPDPCDLDINTNCGGGGGGGGSWVWEPYREYTDWFQVSTVGIVNYVQYLGSDFVIKTRNVWVPDNTSPSPAPHEHISAGNGGHPTSSPHPSAYLKSGVEAWEEQINDSQLKPCMQHIMNDLTTLTLGVGQIVSMFAGSTPGYNWEAKDGPLNGATGSTSTNYNTITGIVTTTFDSQAWLAATELSWARTMLHEAVHAYVVAVNYNSSTVIQRQQLLGPDWAIAFLNYGHDYMAKNYVNPIATALEEYGNNKGYNYPQQFYIDMAWAGLQGTSVFNALSSNDKNRILDIIAVELTGKDVNGNSKTQKGTNAGC